MVLLGLHFDEEKNWLKIFGVNRGAIQLEGSNHKLTFTVKTLFKGL